MRRRICLIIAVVLFAALTFPILLPATTPGQQVTASNDGPISIPGPEVIIRAIPNTGESFFIPPPSSAMRLSPNAPEAATINVTYNGFSAQAQAA
jgi:hypothetical protein